MAVLKTSIVSRNTELDAFATSLNNGYMRIYSGAIPATPETAATGTLLGELRLNATAAPAASGGVLTFNAVSSDASADAAGTMGYARILRSDGTTCGFDADVTATGGGGTVQFATLTTSVGLILSCTSFTYTLPQ